MLCFVPPLSSTTHFRLPSFFSLSSDTFRLPSLFCQDTHTQTHSGGEVERLVLACHLSSALTLALITASPLANAASLGRRSMCSRHKRRREFAPGNMSSSHYGIRKSVWCDRQFTPVAKRSFCFSPSLPSSLFSSSSLCRALSLLPSGSGKHFRRPESKHQNKGVKKDSCSKREDHNPPNISFWSLIPRQDLQIQPLMSAVKCVTVWLFMSSWSRFILNCVFLGHNGTSDKTSWTQ